MDGDFDYDDYADDTTHRCVNCGRPLSVLKGEHLSTRGLGWFHTDDGYYPCEADDDDWEPVASWQMDWRRRAHPPWEARLIEDLEEIARRTR